MVRAPVNSERDTPSKENSGMGCSMEKESSLGLMALSTKENSEIMRSLALADTNGLIKATIKDRL